MTEKQLLNLAAFDGFLRRAQEVDAPFMLKGSLVTRQFMPNPEMRQVVDLDFVYLSPIENPNDAHKIFSDWVTTITTININDHVRFRSFSKNKFWREIYYAMHDDFPTVNTDLLCYINNIKHEIHLDVSFNLDIDYTPEQLNYEPLYGEPFIIEKTCPFVLQISWKLHQCLVRPRVKDIFDLIHLLKYPQFNETVLVDILKALKKECDKDKIGVRRLFLYVENTMIETYKNNLKTELTWIDWESNKPLVLSKLQELRPHHMEDAKYFTYEEFFPYANLVELLSVFKETLNSKGFNIENINTILSKIY